MVDDWKEEYLPRLEKSFLFKTLKDKCIHKDNEVIALVENGVHYSYQRTKTIIKHMGEFTLHDSDHLFRVLHIMEDLLGESNIKNLTVPELMLLILGAFFHDIGMAPSEKKVITWKKFWDESPDIDDSELKSFKKFQRFCNARPRELKNIELLIENGDNTRAETIKGYLITDFIRQTHAERARSIIDENWNPKIKYRDTDLTVEFAQICYSHNEDALSLLELDKDYLCGEGTFACLPLVGVILRLADILDFDGKRTPEVLFSHLNVRHPISIKEWQKHRSIDAKEIDSNLIQFSAKCTHPAIEVSIHEFCDQIDQELLVCNNIIPELNDFYKNRERDISVKLPKKVNREKIRTKKNIRNEPIYQYRKTQFNLSKQNVIDLLMGTKLYGNPEVALRELLQNSIDACQLRKAQEEEWNNPYEPKITVKYYQEDGNDILEIIDNGTGMDQSIIDKYYSQIGSSFYKSTEFYDLKSETRADFVPTSRFGIGILSCFMVSDTLIVDTRRVYGPHNSSDPIKIRIEGEESLFWTQIGQRNKPGTTTKLILRDSDNPWDRMSEEEFIESVETVIPNPPFKIHIKTAKEEKIRDENSFKEFNATSLKGYSWKDHEDNVRTIELKIDKPEKGIVGSAIVAVLEKNKLPTDLIELTAKDIEIDGDIYSLEKSLQLSENCIGKSTKSITIDESGDIHEESSSSKIHKSDSRLSLHGIEVPTSLFKPKWQLKRNQASIDWPIPLILVVDVCGNRDLDLNSARTEINFSDKWRDFEEELAYQICTGIKISVQAKYWEKLYEVLIENTENEIFINGLDRVMVD